MNSKLNYAIALLRSIASVRQMFERIDTTLISNIIVENLER